VPNRLTSSRSIENAPALRFRALTRTSSRRSVSDTALGLNGAAADQSQVAAGGRTSGGCREIDWRARGGKPRKTATQRRAIVRVLLIEGRPRGLRRRTSPTAKAYTWIWKPEAGVARVKQKVMTKQECDFTIAHLDELWRLIQALKVLHGLEFPGVLERCRELLSRLADDSRSIEFLEVHQFLDWAEGIIKPSLRELPEYQHALRDFLVAWRVTGPIA